MNQKQGGGDTPRLLVIGIGNEFRSDDGVGRIVAGKLAGELPTFIEILLESGEGAALIDAWSGARAVFVIDAVRSGAVPGTAFRVDASEQKIPTGYFNYSSHAFSLAEAVELSRALGTLPHTCMIYGIEGKSFTSGTGLSDEVRHSVPDVIRQITADVQSFLSDWE